MTIITTESAALTGRSSATTTYLAGPLDQVNAWVSQWGTSLQILGGTILAICMVLVGIKLGAKSVASNGASTGHREAVGAIFGLVIAGVLIGAALIIVPLFVGVGSNSGTTPAPAPRRGHRRRITPPSGIRARHLIPRTNGGETLTGNDDQVIYSDDYTRLFTYQSRQFTAGDLSLKAINGVQWNAALPAAVIAAAVTVVTAAGLWVVGFSPWWSVLLFPVPALVVYVRMAKDRAGGLTESEKLRLAWNYRYSQPRKCWGWRRTPNPPTSPGTSSSGCRLCAERTAVLSRHRRTGILFASYRLQRAREQRRTPTRARHCRRVGGRAAEQAAATVRAAPPGVPVRRRSDLRARHRRVHRRGDRHQHRRVRHRRRDR